MKVAAEDYLRETLEGHVMNAEPLDFIQNCLNGDEEAWAVLVAEYKGLVYSICNLSNISDQDAEDLAQEAFIKIWMNLPKYDPKRGTLKGWISSLTRNLRVDRFRRQGQERITDSLDEGWDQNGIGSMAVQIPDQGQSPQGAAISNEALRIVGRAVREISPIMREVVSLRLFKEFDDQEIARRLSIPEGTVKSRGNRGRAELASLLSPMRVAFAV
jgi:RNA polymerase sigma-70 factor, ECF subfamily